MEDPLTSSVRPKPLLEQSEADPTSRPKVVGSKPTFRKIPSLEIMWEFVTLATSMALIPTLQVKLNPTILLTGVVSCVMCMALTRTPRTSKNRAFILAVTIQTTLAALATKDTRYLFQIAPLATMLLRKYDHQITSSILIVSSFILPGPVAIISAAILGMTKYGFYDEVELVQSLCRTMEGIRMTISASEDVDPNEISRLTKIAKEIENCVISRNKISAMLALRKLARECLSVPDLKAYAPVFDQFYHDLKDAIFESKLQSSMEILHTMMLSAGVMGYTFSATLDGVGKTVCNHMNRSKSASTKDIPSASEDEINMTLDEYYEAFNEMVNEEIDERKPEHKYLAPPRRVHFAGADPPVKKSDGDVIIPVRDYVQTNGSHRYVNNTGMTRLGDLYHAAMVEWAAASKEEPKQSTISNAWKLIIKGSSYSDDSKEIGRPYLGCFINLSVSDPSRTEYAGCPAVLGSSNLAYCKTKDQAFLETVYTNTDYKERTRIAAANLCCCLTFGAEKAKYLSEKLLSANPGSLALATGANSSTLVRGLGEFIKSNGASSADENVSVLIPVVKKVISAHLFQAASDLSTEGRDQRLLAPTALIDALRDLAYKAKDICTKYAGGDMALATSIIEFIDRVQKDTDVLRIAIIKDVSATSGVSLCNLDD